MFVPACFIRLIPLPKGVKGLVTPNDDNTYNVYINENLSDSQRREALFHELGHIEKDHLYSDNEVSEIEKDADSFIPVLKADA